MKARLNITIEQRILNEIKKYSDRNNVSISKIVEEYFKKVTAKPKQNNLLERIRKLPKPLITPGIDLKKAYYDEKYQP
ncbi:MAG: DUF6364 family protein [Niabella sp.]